MEINQDLIDYYPQEHYPMSFDDEYPKHLKYYQIKRIPPAEPHVLITDDNENYQQWYDIPMLIREFFDQAYVAYYNGMYVASLSCAINSIELVLKYELVRIEQNPEKLNENYYSLGNMIKKLKIINLEEYTEKLKLVNNIRAGIFHYNVIRLKTAMNKLEIEDLTENVDYWSFAYFIYNLAAQIFWKLYDNPKMLKKQIKEGLDDYNKKYLKEV